VFCAGNFVQQMDAAAFLDLDSSDCLIAEEGKQLAGFILAESNPPLAHIITLDIAAAHRRKGVGSALLREMEQHFAYHGVLSVLLETAVDNGSAVAFWGRHGYSAEAGTETVLSGECGCVMR